MKKVLMLPKPTQAAHDTTNAIHNIVLKLAEHLPAFGYELTENEADADLIVGHAGQTYGQGNRLDVAHCHGLYPTGIFGETDWHWAANETVIKNLRVAKAITVPSQWVADILRRDMHVEPHVIGWAIEASEWPEPEPHQGYVLWNKTRQDRVCDPAPLIALAQQLPGQQFVTTFGSGGENVRTIGLQPHEAMCQIVRGAEVYLATTKETFGIGTLEAMVSGVPILGYKWGGTADIVEHGVTGYLVEPGDVDGLVEGLAYCKQHRAILGANARQVALTYTWEQVARSFAAIYDSISEQQSAPKVSVIIPLHNYGRFVGEAIDSVLAQETTFEYELLVVENGSTDDSYAVAKQHIGDKGTVITLGKGVGPAHARNHGIEQAHGEFIVCLDADDRLGHPEFLQRLAEVMDADPTLGIAFTGLTLFRDVDGERQYRYGNWPEGFNFDLQCAGKNQVPTCCMFRKEAWRRTGGYRSYAEPAEDAELWLRIGGLGYGATQVTRERWFFYRWHEDSLSHPVRIQEREEPDWRRYHPWVKNGSRPLAALGNPTKRSWPVRNYDRAIVTFVVPCGKGHEQYLSDALDSIEGQTDWRWSCVVVNDSGAPLDLQGHPWAKVVDTGGNKGPGYARNRGVEAANTPLIAFLDADDFLEPRFLEETLRLYQVSGRYIYVDWMTLNDKGQVGRHETPDYEPGIVFRQTSIHSINILIERSALLKVGGFDESMAAWEDVDLFMKLAAAGYCGKRVPRYLMFYRHQTGMVRERGETIKSDLKKLLYERYKPYMEREKVCDCANIPKVKIDTSINMAAQSVTPNKEMVRIIYNGPTAAHDVYGGSTKQHYGRRSNGDVFYVWRPDSDASPMTFQPIPDVDAVIEPTRPPAPPELLLYAS